MPANISTKPFPSPVRFRNLLGPSFIILALGLGSGEVILWPYLSANVGLGIAWGALLGITFQFFINMEIERYALVKGESVFVGINTLFPRAAYWFIASTFIGFGLPGIVAAAAEVFGFVIGVHDYRWLAILFLLSIGVILSVGKTVYDIMETVTKTIIFVGIPFIVLLTITLSTRTDWAALGAGLIGQGGDYFLLPAGLSLATFLAAFAYSGAGGNLNLTQSIYIKEKGYGMGAYAQKISGLFRGTAQERKIKLSGESFEMNKDNLKNFQAWWRLVNLEHLLVFWLLGFVGIAVLMVLAFSTTYGLETNAQGILFVINEGIAIGKMVFPAIGTLFLLVISVMLFQTQLGVLDSTSRIMAENVAIKKIAAGKSPSLSTIYFLFVWTQIAFGIALFLFNIAEPRFLIVVGAIINALAMFVHIGLVNWTNYKLLPKAVQPHLIRRLIILGIFVFFGVFSTITIADILR